MKTIILTFFSEFIYLSITKKKTQCWKKKNNIENPVNDKNTKNSDFLSDLLRLFLLHE